MRRKISVLALMLAFGLASSQVAHATTYREYCSSIPGECEFTGPTNAPVLAVNVCWSRSTSTARLMTGATCPTGSYPFFVKYGVVDPLTQIVTGLVPLDDACTRPGLCQPSYLAPPTTWSDGMCCIGDTCWPANGVDCEGELLFCANGVTNEDGTVECFDDTEA
jgi:hypothetical protein